MNTTTIYINHPTWRPSTILLPLPVSTLSRKNYDDSTTSIPKLHATFAKLINFLDEYHWQHYSYFDECKWLILLVICDGILLKLNMSHSRDDKSGKSPTLDKNKALLLNSTLRYCFPLSVLRLDQSRVLTIRFDVLYLFSPKEESAFGDSVGLGQF